jgi:DNA-binding MarR family transcriptional regulator
VRIVRGQKIAGVPIERVRHLMRRSTGLEFGVAMISHELDLSDGQARRLATALLAAGYIRKTKHRRDRATFYERTLDGSTLAAATMAAPLRRSTVERLLTDVVERARAINANDAYAYRVVRIALFGSALGDDPRPGDVDLAVMLAKRNEDPVEQERAEHARRRVAWEGGRRFHDIDDLFWPETEVRLALRRRSRGLSLVDADTPSRLGAKAKVIFEDSNKRTKSRAG